MIVLVRSYNLAQGQLPCSIPFWNAYADGDGALTGTAPPVLLERIGVARQQEVRAGARAAAVRAAAL